MVYVVVQYIYDSGGDMLYLVLKLLRIWLFSTVCGVVVGVICRY